MVERIEELYSRFSILTKISEGMQLSESSQKIYAMYQWLVQQYNQKGYFTNAKIEIANRMYNILTDVNNQSKCIEKELGTEIVNYIAKKLAKCN